MQKYVQLHYGLYETFDSGKIRHPQEVMKSYGFEVIHAVPQSMGGCWWFTVKPYNFQLPDFINVMETGYSLKY